MASFFFPKKNAHPKTLSAGERGKIGTSLSPQEEFFTKKKGGGVLCPRFFCLTRQAESKGGGKRRRFKTVDLFSSRGATGRPCPPEREGEGRAFPLSLRPPSSLRSNVMRKKPHYSSMKERGIEGQYWMIVAAEKG